MPATDHLQAARDELEAAHTVAENDEEAVESAVDEVAEGFDAILEGETQPDHSVVDAHLNTLRQVSEGATGDTELHLEAALDHAERYRQGLDQA